MGYDSVDQFIAEYVTSKHYTDPKRREELLHQIQAQGRVDGFEIDMVILDMVMPEMGGGEIYEKLKEINPDVKVLLSSGYSLDSQATEILKRGCNGFMQKPFNMKELSQRIREILE